MNKEEKINRLISIDSELEDLDGQLKHMGNILPPFGSVGSTFSMDGWFKDIGKFNESKRKLLYEKYELILN